MKSPLSYSILSIAMIWLQNAACKKSIDTPPVTYTTLKVLEYKTNFPIAGAEVKIYECTKQGFGGCADLSLRKTVTTDKDGNFRFDARLHAYVVDASESRYWTGGTGGEDFGGNALPVTNIFLTPVAYTKIHIREINPHPTGIFMALRLVPDSSLLLPFPVVFNGPTDTTFVLESFGNRKNLVYWYFTDAMGNEDSTQNRGQLPSYYINRFDTVSLKINY